MVSRWLQIDRIGPDVVVSVVGPTMGPSVIRELRTRVDAATSIIVIADLEDCERPMTRVPMCSC